MFVFRVCSNKMGLLGIIPGLIPSTETAAGPFTTASTYSTEERWTGIPSTNTPSLFSRLINPSSAFPASSPSAGKSPWARFMGLLARSICWACSRGASFLLTPKPGSRLTGP